MPKQRTISFITALLFLSILFGPSFAKAEKQTIIISDEIVNIREGPGLEYPILAKASKNESYSLLKEEGDWSLIEIGNNQKGWVANWLITKSPTLNSKKAERKATSNADHLRVRKEPSTNAEIIGVMNKGESFTILKTKQNWVKLLTPAGDGWVYKEYVMIHSQASPKSTSEDKDEVKKMVEEKNVMILQDKTNIRTGPDLSYDIIQKANSGNTFPIIESEKNWYKIRLANGDSGYVAAWVVSLENTNGQSKQKNPLKNKVIVIDPGHGGQDKGTTGFSSTNEKDLTLRTAKLLAEQLESAGATVVLTRVTDTFLSLPSRVKIAGKENADAFISIHYDSIFDSSIQGVTTYYYHSYQKPLAIEVHSALSGLSIMKDRGLKFGDYHVLRENTQKAILLELGYLSNPTEEKLAKSEQYQKLVSSAIFEGLKHYFSKSY
ncbi:N-acetylmuramoyl-L-alanine amidase [Cytobacillus sp. Hz8]|uniref:N-acetylmuramoyl-L-alanine amidase n=1 Tax=Cytobacillus sp. Hz8 TaxID=3347168 RepID=UPI0035D63259